MCFPCGCCQTFKCPGTSRKSSRGASHSLCNSPSLFLVSAVHHVVSYCHLISNASCSDRLSVGSQQHNMYCGMLHSTVWGVLQGRSAPASSISVQLKLQEIRNWNLAGFASPYHHRDDSSLQCPSVRKQNSLRVPYSSRKHETVIKEKLCISNICVMWDLTLAVSQTLIQPMRNRTYPWFTLLGKQSNAGSGAAGQ